MTRTHHPANRPELPVGDDGIEDHDRGLQFDLPNLMTRRRALTMLGGLGAAGVLAGCKVGGSTATSGSTTSTTSGATTSTTAGSGSTSTTAAAGATSVSTEIPDETGGPFPGDGSNGPDVLTQSGVVRSDIRSSFGSSTNVAEGVPLTVDLTVLSAAAGFTPLAGAAVYIWHCTRDGEYSMYGQGVTNENYLRGVQITDGDGKVSFTSIFPAAYSGRWPHIHFEIYPDVDAATSGGTKLKTSQLALPEDACNEVYATTGYSTSVTNLARTSLSTDMVFRDGWSSELATVTGSPSSGMAASLSLAV